MRTSAHEARLKGSPSTFRRASPDGFCPTQRADLVVAIAGLAQNFLRVLAEERRAARDVRRRSAHLDRRSERLDAPQRWMLRLDDHLAREDLRIGKHLRVVVD